MLLQLLFLLITTHTAKSQAPINGCVKLCLAVCQNVDTQWRRCMDSSNSAGGCHNSPPSPYLALHYGTNDCPISPWFWGKNPPSGNVWGDPQIDMTQCADKSYPKLVQQQGTFDNLTACINYVTAIEQTNLFGHPAMDLTTKIGKDTTHQLILETTSTTNETNAGNNKEALLSGNDLSCPNYSSNADPTKLRLSCLYPMAWVSNFSYMDKDEITKHSYCPGSHVEVYNTMNSQNYSNYNLQVMMLSCNNVVIIAYRGTVMRKYTSDLQQNRTATTIKKEKGIFSKNFWWNILLDMSALYDDWVVPVSVSTVASNNNFSNKNNSNSNSNGNGNGNQKKNDTAPQSYANAYVHHGFKQSVEAVQPAVRTFLSKYYSKTKRLLVTGHSLGGAMATIGSFDLHHGVDGDPYPVTLAVTFGAPRSLSAAWFDSTSRVTYDVPTLRVTHHRDVVPHVPPRSCFLFTGYHHVGREVYLEEDCCQETACDGSGEDGSCNGGFNFFWSVIRGGLGNHMLVTGYTHALLHS